MEHTISPAIHQLLDYARLAPSVHNTQPWSFRVDNNKVSIIVEPSRKLGPGDPTGRETWISFGICLEALLEAASGLGMTAEIIHLQTDQLKGVIATIHITPEIKEKQSPQTLAALRKRFTYRETMVPATIPTELNDRCKTIIKDLTGVNILTTQDRPTIRHIGNLTLKAMTLALGDPHFRDELYHYVHSNWSRARTGLHGYALGEGLLGSIFGKLSVKLGMGLSLKAKHDQQRIIEASALVFITTSGDTPRYWLQAGRAYMRVALEIAKTDLMQGTLAAPIEASSFHEDIESMLHTTDRIQTMLRIGGARGVQKRHSPRLSVEELLA